MIDFPEGSVWLVGAGSAVLMIGEALRRSADAAAVNRCVYKATGTGQLKI